jgi:hypothetical protein
MTDRGRFFRLSHDVAHLTPEKVGLSTAAKVLDL